jgi:hypothetical protein
VTSLEISQPGRASVWISGVDDHIFLVRISTSFSRFTNSTVPRSLSLSLELPFPRTQCDFVISR